MSLSAGVGAISKPFGCLRRRDIAHEMIAIPCKWETHELQQSNKKKEQQYHPYANVKVYLT